MDRPFLFFGFLLKFSYHVTQPMLGSMQAVSAVIHKASANNFTGSAVLNLLQSQVKNLLTSFHCCSALASLLFSYFLGTICFICNWCGFYCIQAKAMAGDNTVRSLLEKMTQCASNAYLGILERYVLLAHYYYNSFLVDILKVLPHSAFRRFYFMDSQLYILL